MSVKPCPEGMRWINPYLTVKDAEKSLEFYARAFGFEKRFTMPGPDGKIGHAEMVHRDSTIMFGPECPQNSNRAPSTLGGTCVTLYTYVENVDELTKRARSAGAKVAVEPTDMFWGDRCATLVDPDGHTWMFATHVRDVSPQDMHP